MNETVVLYIQTPKVEEEASIPYTTSPLDSCRGGRIRSKLKRGYPVRKGHESNEPNEPKNPENTPK